MTREEMFVHLNALKHITDESSMMWLALDMAIKSLEQEPCEDAISRQAVRHILNHEVKMPIKVWKKLFELVDCLPPITLQPKTGHWIPVSERLPVLRGKSKISDDVLITNGFENDMGYLVERKGKIFWHYYGGEYEVCIKDEDNDATAWMPLPEPYKAESEEV